MRVLVLEKDENVISYVTEALRQVWCETEVCSDAETGICSLRQCTYDTAILGEHLDGMDSFAFLRRIRSEHCQIPILMLFNGNSKKEADRNREENGENVLGEMLPAASANAGAHILALDCGADYCLNLPADERELLAVLKALDRRRGEMLPERLALDDLALDQTTFTLSGPNGSFQLGKKEFDVMRILLINRGIVVSKEALLEKVWGSGSEAIDNNVEVYISFLRKKLEILGVRAHIVTMRRLGYKLTTEEA